MMAMALSISSSVVKRPMLIRIEASALARVAPIARSTWELRVLVASQAEPFATSMPCQASINASAWQPGKYMLRQPGARFVWWPLRRTSGAAFKMPCHKRFSRNDKRSLASICSRTVISAAVPEPHRKGAQGVYLTSVQPPVLHQKKWDV